MTAYFDNSATAPLSPYARKRMERAFDIYGNPSSLHTTGEEAAVFLSECRGIVEKAVGQRDGRIIFTAGGSEANNLALRGIAYAKKRNRGGKIIISAAEHPSVLNAAAFLESEGFRVQRIGAPRGVLDFDALERELTPDVFLVSVMLVNNELGYINDISHLYSIVKQKTSALVHTDAVQGFSLAHGVKCDMLSVSGHKIGAPKGVGALFVSESVIKNRAIVPFICGGEQEYGLRAGTENTVGIAGFAGACEDISENGRATEAHLNDLSCYLRDGLRSIPDVTVNQPEGSYCPHIINLSVGRIRAQTLMNYLSFRGVMISAGSACSSKSKDISPALRSFGLNEAQARSSVRISVGGQNTKEECDLLLEALCDAADSLKGSTDR